MIIRRGLADVFTGKKSFPIITPLTDEEINDGKIIRKGLVSLFQNQHLQITASTKPSTSHRKDKQRDLD
jgi:hypothetical protein